MISDREIWQAAGAMVKRYGEDAATEAAMRADELLDEGDMDGCAVFYAASLVVFNDGSAAHRVRAARRP